MMGMLREGTVGQNIEEALNPCSQAQDISVIIINPMMKQAGALAFATVALLKVEHVSAQTSIDYDHVTKYRANLYKFKSPAQEVLPQVKPPTDFKKPSLSRNSEKLSAEKIQDKLPIQELGIEQKKEQSQRQAEQKSTQKSPPPKKIVPQAKKQETPILDELEMQEFLEYKRAKREKALREQADKEALQRTGAEHGILGEAPAGVDPAHIQSQRRPLFAPPRGPPEIQQPDHPKYATPLVQPDPLLVQQQPKQQYYPFYTQPSTQQPLSEPEEHQSYAEEILGHHGTRHYDLPPVPYIEHTHIGPPQQPVMMDQTYWQTQFQTQQRAQYQLQQPVSQQNPQVATQPGTLSDLTPRQFPLQTTYAPSVQTLAPSSQQTYQPYLQQRLTGPYAQQGQLMYDPYEPVQPAFSYQDLQVPQPELPMDFGVKQAAPQQYLVPIAARQPTQREYLYDPYAEIPQPIYQQTSLAPEMPMVGAARQWETYSGYPQTEPQVAGYSQQEQERQLTGQQIQAQKKPKPQPDSKEEDPWVQAPNPRKRKAQNPSQAKDKEESKLSPTSYEAWTRPKKEDLQPKTSKSSPKLVQEGDPWVQAQNPRARRQVSRPATSRQVDPQPQSRQVSQFSHEHPQHISHPFTSPLTRPTTPHQEPLQPVSAHQAQLQPVQKQPAQPQLAQLQPTQTQPLQSQPRPVYQQQWRSDMTGLTELVSIYPTRQQNEANELLDELVGGTIDYVAEKVVGSVIKNESPEQNELLDALVGGTIDYVASKTVDKIFENGQDIEFVAN